MYGIGIGGCNITMEACLVSAERDQQARANVSCQQAGSRRDPTFEWCDENERKARKAKGLQLHQPAQYSVTLAAMQEEPVHDVKPKAGLREIGDSACWWVTSAKPGNGVEQLRDGRTDTFWQ